MKSLHTIISKRRMQLNYSQTNVGLMIGLSQKQYGRIETGESELRLNDFVKLCQALDIHPCDALEESNLLSNFSECQKGKRIKQLQSEISQLNKRLAVFELLLTKNAEKL